MDCYLPADFFIVDDTRRHEEFDASLGADAHVHLEAPAFVTGLRDWRNAAEPVREPSRPRGRYPGEARRPRRSRESGNPGAWRHAEATSLDPRFRGDGDEEWHPL